MTVETLDRSTLDGPSTEDTLAHRPTRSTGVSVVKFDHVLVERWSNPSFPLSFPYYPTELARGPFNFSLSNPMLF